MRTRIAEHVELLDRIVIVGSWLVRLCPDLEVIASRRGRWQQ